MSDVDLRNFIRESNRIEGIRRAPTKREIEAHETLLSLPKVTVDDLCRFVLTVAGKPLRTEAGMNVIVGNHRPPPGGPSIEADLCGILWGTENGATPFRTHCRYETLHPFMDGNGRSGRALWLWQMLREGRDPYVLRRGFLHTFYYQTLSEGRP